jgi:hypothetical protein
LVARPSSAGQLRLYGYSAVGYLDDLYVVALDAVTLTVTAATEANSTESTGLRVDGNDLLSQPITGEPTVWRVNFTPRHGSGEYTKFQANPVLMHARGNAANQWTLFHNADTTTRFVVDIDGNNSSSSSNSYSFTADTTYLLEISQSGADFTFSVDGVEVFTHTAGASAWGTYPTTFYAGCLFNTTRQIDATFSAP